MTTTIAPPAPMRGTHLLAPAAVMAVVLLMVVPLPPLMLDLLLSIDIGLSVVLLLTVIYVKQPVEFSVFPSLLLLLTLVRLSLNVASTRLILMHGQDGVDAAGHVIMSFGQFVVGGNFVVGTVVFLVLDRHSVHRHQPRRRPHFGSHGPVHVGRHARTADGDRCRSECGAHRRARGARPPRPRPPRSRLLRRDGRRDSFHAARRAGGRADHRRQHHRRPHHRRVPARARSRHRRTDLHDPDRRRRSRDRHSGAARLDVGRPDHDSSRVGIEPRRRSRGPVAGARATAGDRRSRAHRSGVDSRVCRRHRSSSSPRSSAARRSRRGKSRRAPSPPPPKRRPPNHPTARRLSIR